MIRNSNPGLENRAMSRSLYHAVLRCLGLACLLIASAEPACAADPGWLGFRNDTNGLVIVQGVSIVNRVPRQGPRHVLKPGQESWDKMITPPATR